MVEEFSNKLDTRIRKVVNQNTNAVYNGVVISEHPNLRIRLTDTMDELILSFNDGHLVQLTEQRLMVDDYVFLVSDKFRQVYNIIGKRNRNSTIDIEESEFNSLILPSSSSMVISTRLLEAGRYEVWEIIAYDSGEIEEIWNLWVMNALTSVNSVANRIYRKPSSLVNVTNITTANLGGGYYNINISNTGTDNRIFNGKLIRRVHLNG